MRHFISESDDDEWEEDSDALIMSDDLLLDTTVQIPSVTQFSITTWSSYDNYKIFGRFLRLFPNLVSLKLDTEYSLLHDILKLANEDEFVKSALTRIEQLAITSWIGRNTLTDAEIHYLFPNVINLIK